MFLLHRLVQVTAIRLAGPHHLDMLLSPLFLAAQFTLHNLVNHYHLSPKPDHSHHQSRVRHLRDAFQLYPACVRSTLRTDTRTPVRGGRFWRVRRGTE